MSTSDIASMNNTINSINTAMATSNKGIRIARYESAISKLSKQLKKHNSILESIDKKLSKVTDHIKSIDKDMDKVWEKVNENSSESNVDPSKFLSVEYSKTIEDLIESIDSIWSVIDGSDELGSVEVDELLEEDSELEPEEPRTSRRKR